MKLTTNGKLKKQKEKDGKNDGERKERKYNVQKLKSKYQWQ